MEAQGKERLASSPRHGEWVGAPSGGGGKVDAWAVYPERKDRAPVLWPCGGDDARVGAAIPPRRKR